MRRPHPEQRMDEVCGFEFAVLDPRTLMPGERFLQVCRFPEQDGEAGVPGTCTHCGEAVVMKRDAGGIVLCGICTVAALSVPGDERDAFLAELRTLRREDPDMLKMVVLACLERSGAGRVTPGEEGL